MKNKIDGSRRMGKVSVVIPALNEEKAIRRVLKSVPTDKIKKMGYEVEIVVVDNGSTDKTQRLAIANGAKVFVQPVRGYGNAYKAGFSNVHGDIIVTGDSDLTYPFEDIPKFLKIIEKEDIDFINTNRLENLKSGVMSKSHQFGNWFLTTICKMLWWRFPFDDSQSGMWIFKKEIWNKLNVVSSGMPFSQELKIEAFAKKFKCMEVPIDYRARVGKVKLKAFSDAFGNTTHLFLKKMMS